MNRITANTQVGRKNIQFGLVLFIILGVLVGIPLTVDFLGGSMLTTDQYQSWKVIHGYGVFLAFVNFFFGYCIDPLRLNRLQKEIASWSFVTAGLVGGIGRSVLYLLAFQGGIGGYATSLIETVGFIVGTVIFVKGLIRERYTRQLEKAVPAVSKLR